MPTKRTKMTNSNVPPLVRIANGVEELIKEIQKIEFPGSKQQPTLAPGLGEAFALGIAKGFSKSLREALDGDLDAFQKAKKLRETLETAESVAESLQKTVPDDILKDRKDATDVVRKTIEDVVADDNYKEKFIQAMADAYGVKLISDVTHRVGK